MKNLLDFDRKIMGNYGSYICGVDEVGVSSLAGPMCAAAVILDYDKIKDDFCYFADPKKEDRSKFIQAMDSKKLTEDEREFLKDKISEAILEIGYGKVKVPEINKIKNIHTTGFLARKRAVENIEKYIPDVIIVDYFDMPEIEDIPILSITKADDKSLAVACASIMAKCWRDGMMRDLHNSNKQYRRYHWISNKGYKSRAHISALRKYGKTKLHRDHLIAKYF